MIETTEQGIEKELAKLVPLEAVESTLTTGNPSDNAKQVYFARLRAYSADLHEQKILTNSDVAEGVERANETIRRWRAGQLK